MDKVQVSKRYRKLIYLLFLFYHTVHHTRVYFSLFQFSTQQHYLYPGRVPGNTTAPPLFSLLRSHLPPNPSATLAPRPPTHSPQISFAKKHMALLRRTGRIQQGSEMFLMCVEFCFLLTCQLRTIYLPR